MNNLNAPASKETGEATPPLEKPAAPGETDADRALVEQVLAGKVDAFEHLFVKYRQLVFAASWRLLRDEQAALDVVQDAFVKAYEQLGNLRGDGRFYPWLRRIAVNLSIDRLRHVKRGGEVSLNQPWTAGEDQGDDAGNSIPDDRPDGNPAQQAETSELNAALSAALLKLSVPHRTVFMLHAAEGMSYKEIAETLGCNTGTVMSRLFYARKHLQDLLEPHLREI